MDRLSQMFDYQNTALIISDRKNTEILRKIKFRFVFKSILNLSYLKKYLTSDVSNRYYLPKLT